MGVNNKRITTINNEGRATLWLYLVLIIICNYAAFRFIPQAWIAYLILLITVTILFLLINFFRNPRRIFPSQDRKDVIVAAADGKIVAIEEVDETDYFMGRCIVISTFMNIFSVHANWVPSNGTVTKVEHTDGSFHAAFKPKSSTENERSLIVIKTDTNKEIMVRQIAGAMARRVVTYCKPGQECSIDQHLGFIKFGSRVDIYIPKDSFVCVKLGQKVKANHTILAKLQ